MSLIRGMNIMREMAKAVDVVKQDVNLGAKYF